MVIGPMACLRTILLLLALALAAPTAAQAKDGGGGGDDVRVGGTCSSGGTSKLRVRSHDGEIRVEFEVKRRRSGERWRVVLVHERRVAWRGTRRTSGSNGSFRVRRSVADFDGADQVTARATGPRGITCRASATLRG